jgi:electron transfer flavoprotein alpha subunit
LRINTHSTLWISLAEDAQVDIARQMERKPADVRVINWKPHFGTFYERSEIRQILASAKQAAGVARLTDAAFIVDVGFGVGNRDGYEQVIEPLLDALKRIGISNVMVGGSRKVTEELHLLPVEWQIGQSGVSVNPRILLAIGISGAPQHVNYIGSRAVILAFNRDPEAPIMVLNRSQPHPRVFGIVGDLFHTVPAFIAALLHEESGQSEQSIRRPAIVTGVS